MDKLKRVIKERNENQAMRCGGKVKEYAEGGTTKGYAGGETGGGPDDPIPSMVVTEEGPSKPVTLHGGEFILTADENTMIQEMVDNGSSDEEIGAIVREAVEKAKGKEEVEEEEMEEEMFS